VTVAFTDNRYSRGHRWLLDGGVECGVVLTPRRPAAMSVQWRRGRSVRCPLSNCHMLSFLYIAASAEFVIDECRDGVASQNEEGKVAMTVVTPAPRSPSSASIGPPRGGCGDAPRAHEQCFHRHPVLTDVRCEPVGMRFDGRLKGGSG
jgi:hypothetical protein